MADRDKPPGNELSGRYAGSYRAIPCGDSKVGLHPPQVIEPDGKLHRFATNGKARDDAGWYVFYGDGIPAGAFGDWRSGLSETWRADIGRKLSPQEETAHRARVEAIRREREAEDVKRKAEARERAAAIWQAAGNSLRVSSLSGQQGHQDVRAARP